MMEIAAILALVMKGISIIEGLSQAGQPIASAINAIKNLNKPASGITQADLDQAEQVLDALMDQFNLPLVRPEGA